MFGHLYNFFFNRFAQPYLSDNASISVRVFPATKIFISFPALSSNFFLSVCWPMLSVHISLALCSQKGLKNVFDEAILAALEPPEPKKKRKCVLLWVVYSHLPVLPLSPLCSAKAGPQLYTLKAMCKKSEFQYLLRNKDIRLPNHAHVHVNTSRLPTCPLLLKEPF